MKLMTGSNDQLIHENAMYDVYVGDAEVSDMQGKVYKVVNRQYEVIEMETSVLMRALYSADDFMAHVQSHSAEISEGVLQ